MFLKNYSFAFQSARWRKDRQSLMINRGYWFSWNSAELSLLQLATNCINKKSSPWSRSGFAKVLQSWNQKYEKIIKTKFCSITLKLIKTKNKRSTKLQGQESYRISAKLEPNRQFLRDFALLWDFKAGFNFLSTILIPFSNSFSAHFYVYNKLQIWTN